MSEKINKKYRTEHDSMGELQVPADALWGAQTQRAVNNFPISGMPMPRSFLRALGLVKSCCAEANRDLDLLDSTHAEAIADAAWAIARGEHDAQFPVDVFQTGSGTSTNMNANEVIAALCAAGGQSVHPNDHVNMSQSSNDVIPTAVQVAVSLEIHETLVPGLAHLEAAIVRRAHQLDGIVKTGRTHLMDAMPITFGQELRAWAAQTCKAIERVKDSLRRVQSLPIGGTAVGTGINAPPEFGPKVCEHLSASTGLEFRSSDNYFMGLASQDVMVEVSGQLKAAATALMKIANDLRWMNSGPLAGLGEIELPPLQPGSSIMPGKVNPVIPEAVAMVCVQVIGNDAAVTAAGQASSFQLSVMWPVVAHNVLQSVELLSNAARVLADKAISEFKVREENVAAAVSRNPILVTALNPVIGYEKGAAIAKRAYAEGRTVIDVALEETDLSEAELKRLLDPTALTKGGIQG